MAWYKCCQQCKRKNAGENRMKNIVTNLESVKLDKRTALIGAGVLAGAAVVAGGAYAVRQARKSKVERLVDKKHAELKRLARRRFHGSKRALKRLQRKF